ncbi:MAG: hypothetical protein V3S71_04245 [Acidobacteriota bacterium]
MTRRQGPISKKELREQRQHAAIKRRLIKRSLWISIWGVVGLAVGLWAYDRSGPQELVQAEVTRTQQYQHVTQGGGAHSHTRATIRIEDWVEAALERAPNVQRGQKIQVWIRRGRLSGRPYFQEVSVSTNIMDMP